MLLCCGIFCIYFFIFILAHNTVIAMYNVKTGKTDVWPQKELLDMLKSIATEIKS